jgi:hypothetical protein
MVLLANLTAYDFGYMSFPSCTAHQYLFRRLIFRMPAIPPQSPCQPDCVSTVSAVLVISLPWPYLISMCNLTALPPDRLTAKRHQCGTIAALRRCRTAKLASSQRTKIGQIRYLYEPNCGIFPDTGTGWPRLASFFGLQPAPTRASHLENQGIYATWLMYKFSCPKLYLGLPFSPPGPAWPPFSSPSSHPTVYWCVGRTLQEGGHMGPPLRLWAQSGVSLPLRRRDACATISKERRLGHQSSPQARCLRYQHLWGWRERVWESFLSG